MVFLRIFCILTFAFVLVSPINTQAAEAVSIPASKSWTDTGVNLRKGESVRITASGQVSVSQKKGSELWFGRNGYDWNVGPRGTYRFEPLDLLVKKYHLDKVLNADTVPTKVFPLPAGYWGPWPAYSLIGRIGSGGQPFYVGERLDLSAPAAGRLYLGVNDFDFSDNSGSWSARILTGAEPLTVADPVRERKRIVPTAGDTPPPAVAASDRRSAIVIYVDGMRPDVLDEMVRMGFMPNIADVFYRNGTQVNPTFTVYPSSTIPANAVLWTGVYSDRNGIKDQALLQRETSGPGKEINRVTEFSPEENYNTIRNQGVKTIFDYFKHETFTTILPINNFSPPLKWIGEASNTPPRAFGSFTRVERDLDNANFAHAMTFIHSDPRARMMVIWLPEVDDTGHRTPYGQFGEGRKRMVEVDDIIGRLRTELNYEHRWEDTDLVLLSDHGHLGGEPRPNGRARINQVWDVASEFFLPNGMNVNHLNHHWTVPGVPETCSAYLTDGGGGTGYLGIYLPYQRCNSGDWARRNKLRDLQAYKLKAALPPVDLLETFVSQRADPKRYRTDMSGDRPVNMVLVKIDEENFLIYKSRMCQALVTLRRGATARDNKVRYLPVRHYRYDEARSDYRYEANDGADPLGYQSDAAFASGAARAGGVERFLAEFHSETQWLEATANSRYPDAPVMMGHHLFDAPNLKAEIRDADPDMILVPNPGWYFVQHPGDYPPLEKGSQGFSGTSHGYPDRDSMRVPFFFSGPGVRKGAIIESPHTLADLTPSLLMLFGRITEADSLDGRPVTEILEGSK